MLYKAIDESGFYKNPVDPAYRSWMNIPFILPDEALDKPFLAEAKAAGLLTLSGHRSVGGMRASIYNAVPLEGVRGAGGLHGRFPETARLIIPTPTLPPPRGGRVSYPT